MERKLCYTDVRVQAGTTVMENRMGIHKEKWKYLMIHHSIPRHVSKRHTSTNSMGHKYYYVHSFIIKIVKIKEQPKYPSTSNWIKEVMGYILMYYSAIKKNEVLSFVIKWMELEKILRSYVRKEVKGNHRMVSFITHMWQKTIIVSPYLRFWENYSGYHRRYGSREEAV